MQTDGVTLPGPRNLIRTSNILERHVLDFEWYRQYSRSQYDVEFDRKRRCIIPNNSAGLSARVASRCFALAIWNQAAFEYQLCIHRSYLFQLYSECVAMYQWRMLWLSVCVWVTGLVCLRSERKTAWAINIGVGMHWPWGRQVKGRRHAVIKAGIPRTAPTRTPPTPTRPTRLGLYILTSDTRDFLAKKSVSASWNASLSALPAWVCRSIWLLKVYIVYCADCFLSWPSCFAT